MRLITERSQVREIRDAAVGSRGAARLRKRNRVPLPLVRPRGGKYDFVTSPRVVTWLDVVSYDGARFLHPQRPESADDPRGIDHARDVLYAGGVSERRRRWFIALSVLLVAVDVWISFYLVGGEPGALIFVVLFFLVGAAIGGYMVPKDEYLPGPDDDF